MAMVYGWLVLQQPREMIFRTADNGKVRRLVAGTWLVSKEMNSTALGYDNSPTFITDLAVGNSKRLEAKSLLFFVAVLDAFMVVAVVDLPNAKSDC